MNVLLMKRKKPHSSRQSQAGPPAAATGAPASDINENDTLAQARQLISLGRQDEALVLLTRLAQAPLPAPEALEALGRLHMDRREFVEAASVFRRLSRQTPRDAALRNSLAMALVMSGRRPEARPELEEAVRLAPQEPIFQFNLGKYYILVEDYAQGRRVLEGLLPQAPPEMRDQTLGHLNQCLARLGLPLASAQGPMVFHPAPGGAAAPAREMLLCCSPGMDSFVDGLISGLAPRVRVEKLVSQAPEEILAAVKRHQTIWIEWGNELAEFLTRQGAEALKGKRVILRIHAYEVMQGQAERIDYGQVTDLMFVCAGMRDLLLARRPEIRQQVKRIHGIPNGIDTGRFQLTPHPAGLEIAYVGYLNFKKGPMVLMHALKALHSRDQRCHLHVAGIFQDRYSETACRHFLAQNNLEGAVRFHGWVKDVEPWLADKSAIICTSLSESQGLGLMEALAMGLKPLIYNFHTARHIYPRQWLWNNLEELGELVYEAHDPREGRRFVEENYSLDLQVQRLQEMIFEEREVVFAGPRVELAGLPEVPSACFSPSLPERREANQRFGLQLKQAGRVKAATVFLERAWSQSRYQDRQAAQELLDCHLRRARYGELGQVYRQMGLAAAARGDYEAMLAAFYEFYYGAYRHTGSYRWQRFDPAIDTVLRLVADKVEPLPAHQELIARVDPAKVKVALVLESFDPAWATVKRFVDIGRRLDKSRFEVIYLTRMELQDSWRPLLDELQARGCHLLWAPGQEYYAKIQGFLYALRHMGCYVLMLNTQFLTPWYDLLALCGAARRVLKFVAQTGGLESSSDLAVSVLGRDLVEEVAEGVHIGPAQVVEGVRQRAERQGPAGRLKAVCVGRPVKFINNHQFWSVLGQILEEIPGLELSVIGCQARDIFGGQPSPHERLRFLGFRQDVHQLLADYDVLIDTWPLGGGSAVREAHAAGVPVISYATDWHQHYGVDATFEGGLDDFVHPELLLPGFELSRLRTLLGRLAGDLDYYRRIQSQCRSIPALSPAQFTARLEEVLLQLAGR